MGVDLLPLALYQFCTDLGLWELVRKLVFNPFERAYSRPILSTRNSGCVADFPVRDGYAPIRAGAGARTRTRATMQNTQPVVQLVANSSLVIVGWPLAA